MTELFAFACAADLYRQGRHPRLMLSGDDIDRLRRAPGKSWTGKLLAALRRKSRPIVRDVLAAPDLSGELAEIKAAAAGASKTDLKWTVQALPDLALIAAVDHDADALSAVRAVLTRLPAISARQADDSYNLKFGTLGDLAFAYDLVAEQLPPVERRRFCRWAAAHSVKDVLRQIRANHLKCSGMNVTAVGMITALLTVLAVEGDDGAGDLQREWAQLLQFFEASLSTIIGPNGYPEEDIGYGTAMAGAIARCAEALRRAGRYDPYTQAPNYAAFGTAMLHLVQPWGEFLTNTGDHGDDCGFRELILPRQAAELDCPAILWLHGTLSYPSADVDAPDYDPGFWRETMLALGFSVPTTWLSVAALQGAARPRRPTVGKVPTHYCDRGRGLVSFRSGWGPTDTYVTLDGSQRSPSAQGHAHDSCGHFNLSALGEYFSIDTGRYNIEQDQHSVTLIDGRSGRSTDGQWRATPYHGQLTDFRPDPFCDTAAVDSTLQSNCYWARRQLGLVKGPVLPAYVWVIDDINADNDCHEFWFQLQTHPHNRIVTRQQSATITGCRHGNQLDAHIIVPAPKTYPRPHAVVWDSDISALGSHRYASEARLKAATGHRTVHHSVAPRPRLLGKVSGYNGRFLTILLPRQRDAARATVRRLPSAMNTLAAAITVNGITDTIIYAFEHNLLEAGGISARGRFAVVRRRQDTGKVLAWTIAAGRRLAVDGKELLSAPAGRGRRVSQRPRG